MIDMMEIFSHYRRTEKRIKEIEKMDKSGLSLDEQEALINEYTELWDTIDKLNKH